MRAALVVAALLLVSPARAADGPGCSAPPAAGPVSLYILASAHKVQEFAATVKDARVVRRDAKTVVFEDGRVVTADVGSVGDHLNDLGWSRRRIDVVASFPRASARPRAVG